MLTLDISKKWLSFNILPFFFFFFIIHQHLLFPCVMWGHVSDTMLWREQRMRAAFYVLIIRCHSNGRGEKQNKNLTWMRKKRIPDGTPNIYIYICVVGGKNCRTKGRKIGRVLVSKVKVQKKRNKMCLFLPSVVFSFSVT
jgi:hypothetical protein